MTDDEIAQKAAQFAGGVAQRPHVQFVETQPRQIVKPAPLANDDQRTVTLPDLTRPVSLEHAVMVERRQWATSVWIPESEQYDAKQNVLTLLGYHRVYLFDVWVKAGAAWPSDDSEDNEDDEHGEETTQP